MIIHKHLKMNNYFKQIIQNNAENIGNKFRLYLKKLYLERLADFFQKNTEWSALEELPENIKPIYLDNFEIGQELIDKFYFRVDKIYGTKEYSEDDFLDIFINYIKDEIKTNKSVFYIEPFIVKNSYIDEILKYLDENDNLYLKELEK